MKRILVMGLAMTALAGCATPSYPVKQGYVAPPPVTPKYPVRQAPPAASAETPESAPQSSKDSAAQTESAPEGSAAAPGPAPVDSAPLAPVTTAPQTQTTPGAVLPPASSSGLPTTTTQAPAAAAPKPPAASLPESRASAPPPEAMAAPVSSYRKPEVRYLVDGKVVAARGMYRDYQVQQGDHLDAIARDLQTTRHELIDANRLKSPYRLKPGEHLKVPVAKAYVVQSGDTLSAVARRFGIGVGQLSSLNDLPERGRLTPGMYVALPAEYDDRGPTRIEVAEGAYAEPRPRATYRPPATEGYSPAPGPYTPSPDALAAAAARRAQASNMPASSSSGAPAFNPAYTAARPSESSASPIARPGEATTAESLAKLGQGKFIWPVTGEVLSRFGASGIGRRNDGVDIGAPAGSEVRATAVGEVVYAGDQVPGFGNLVLIKHAGGWVSAYAHLASVSVHMRDTVYQGEQLGTVGDTGGVSQPQLHFELRYAASPADKAKPMDPLLILPKLTG